MSEARRFCGVALTAFGGACAGFGAGAWLFGEPALVLFVSGGCFLAAGVLLLKSRP